MATDATHHFDANALLAAQEAPTLTVGRFLYRGRLLSLLEWLPFWERLQQMDATPVGEDKEAAVARLRERLAFYESYLRAVFPRRRYRWWAPDPVRHLLAQPFDVVEQTVGFFFTLQALATFGKAAIEKASTRNGMPSPNKASRPAAAAASE